MAYSDIFALLLPLHFTRHLYYHCDCCNIFGCVRVRERTVGAALFDTEIFQDMSDKGVGGCLITSVYVLFLSTSVFFGFFSDSTNYMFIVTILRGRQEFILDQAVVLFHVVVVLIHGAVFVVLIAKFGNWTAGWNIGMVISVLEDDEDGEGIYRSNALSLSSWYIRGKEKRDLWMMLLFFVVAIASRMPCLYFKCSESPSGNGGLYTGLYVGLICVGNVVKWVSYAACYHDCKTRVLENKGDVEQAQPPAT